MSLASWHNCCTNTVRDQAREFSCLRKVCLVMIPASLPPIALASLLVLLTCFAAVGSKGQNTTCVSKYYMRGYRVAYTYLLCTPAVTEERRYTNGNVKDTSYGFRTTVSMCVRMLLSQHCVYQSFGCTALALHCTNTMHHKQHCTNTMHHKQHCTNTIYHKQHCTNTMHHKQHCTMIE